MKFSSLKLLADENVSSKVVSFLREYGIDVLDTKEQKWFGKEDEELLSIANSEKRFILTHDSDFGTLAIHQGKKFFGVIFLRLKIVNPRNVMNVCAKLLSLDVEISPETIVVVEDTRVRIKFPNSK